MARRAPLSRVPYLLGVLAVVAALVMAGSGSPSLRRHVLAVARRASGQRAHFRDALRADHFQRGNIHAHSTRSDGTAPFGDMVAWYRDHGYQFLAMTEHDKRVDEAELDAFTTPAFVVIPGEEVTDRWGDRPLHVNALCARAVVAGGRTFDRADLGLASILSDIRAQGGTPLVNHPNYEGSLRATDIARGASGRFLLEMWSGLPAVHAMGDGVHPSEEAIWDEVLASDADAIPAAVDDAHGLHEGTAGSNALPGRGWVETFGDETSRAAICAALATGQLYASNGPSFASIAVESDTMRVSTADADASVTFLGARGETLAERRASDAPATRGLHELAYTLTGGEVLVRARLADAQGHHAWTAAYRVSVPSP